MKKVILSLCIALMLSSCSVTTLEQLLLPPTVTPPPTPIPTETPTDIPTLTPVTPSLTYTPTPTLIGFRTPTRTPRVSLTPTALTPFNMITPDTMTPSVVITGFVTVFISAEEFYKKGCEPGSVKFTAQVAKPAEAIFVVLFVRFKSKQTGNTSDWTSIGMQPLGNGTFTHELVPDEMKGLDLYQNAWVQYQLVTTNLDANELGRTAIFSEKLTLLNCSPTVTPTVEPTATVLKP
jgi:hypothetical protein